MARYTYGLIGRPLEHSFSPGYFRAFFEREGIDASYELYELERIEELPQLLEAHPDLRGLNVTLPYKREVLRYASKCSDEVKLLGASNVLSVRRTPEGKPILKAHNTDVEGFRRSLAQLLRGEHPEAWVFGTGGAASAVLRGLDLLGISYRQVSRTPRSGQMSYGDLSLEEAQRTKLWINATPVGLRLGEALPLPYEALGAEHICYDLIYNPSPTTFLNRASERGARTKDGLEMLHIQADEAWKIWTTNEED
ncbi:shikimate dehydrogenase [Porphyromonas sp. oral taxon 278]|jgi:shikimate dehydrogenase|uniref:shikimate dehydrogenase family protein n=1 Tax=Porphyromonas sp. oral taxon 278 TaxID=712437 RepID=UPI0025E3CD2E|nr:shikimate dehydrogenase [Porphyromonas sp. oral taxon 278]